MTRKNCCSVLAGSPAILFIAGLLAGCGPSGPKALLEGDRLVQAGKYSEAIEILKKATGQMPREARAWNCLGLAYHGAGQAAEAAKAYQEALNLSNNLAVARFNLGSLRLEERKYPEAADEFTTYTLLQKGDVNGWLNRGRAELRARRFKEAEKSYGVSTNLNPRLPEAYNALGIIQFNRGKAKDFKDAFESFSTALHVQSNYPPAILNLAIVAHFYLQPKPYDYRPYALQRYNEYLSLSPRPGNAGQIEAISRQLAFELAPPERVTNNLASKSNQVAAAMSPAATNVPPRPPQIVSNTVSPGGLVQSPATNISITPAPVTNLTTPPPAKPEPVVPPPAPVEAPTNQKPDEPGKTVAIEPDRPPRLAASTNPPQVDSPVPARTNKPGFLDRNNPLNLFPQEQKAPPVTVLPANPKNGATGTASGTTDGGLIDPATFRRFSYRTITAPAAGRRDKADSDLENARAAQREGRLKDAISASEKAIRADPAYFGAYFNLGLVANEAGDFEKALRAYETAIVLQPDSIGARFNFAQVLQRAGYVLDAVDELEKLLAAHPNEAPAHLAMANLYAQKLRQVSKARGHYLEALRLDPDLPQATSIRYWLRDNP